MNLYLSKTSNLSLGDSIGLFALVFAFFAFVVDPTPWVKLLSFLGACICSVLFVWISHWTYKWRPLYKLLLSLVLVFALWHKTLVEFIYQIPTVSRLLAFWHRLLFLARQPTARYFEVACLGAMLMLVALLLIGITAGALKVRRNRVTTTKGFLDFKLEAEGAISELPSRLSPIVAIVANVGRVLEAQTAKIAATPAYKTGTQLKNIRSFSKELNKSTRKLRILCNRLETTARRLDDGITGWSIWMGEHQNRDSGMQVFVSTMDGFAKNSMSAKQTTDDYLQKLNSMWGVSQHLNQAIHEHIFEVERVRNALNKMADCAMAAISRLGSTIGLDEGAVSD